MNKQNVIKQYFSSVKTLETQLDELLRAEIEQAEFIVQADFKALELTNEDKRKAYLLVNFPKVENLKKLIKQTQIRREYYKDCLRAITQECS